MSKSLDVRRSISEMLASMTEADKVTWFKLNGLEPGPGLHKLIEAALDDGVAPEDVLATMVEAMTEEGE